MSDEAALALLADHHRSIGPIVRSRGGKVVKRIGDGLMLSFPSAESAVLASLELVEVEPGPLRLRAGVHTGEAVVTPDDLIGHDVNVTARVAAVARGMLLGDRSGISPALQGAFRDGGTIHILSISGLHVCILAGFLSLAIAGLGFIWVAFDDDRQSWHDKIAGTTIVRVPKGTALL